VTFDSSMCEDSKEVTRSFLCGLSLNPDA